MQIYDIPDVRQMQNTKLGIKDAVSCVNERLVDHGVMQMR